MPVVALRIKLGFEVFEIQAKLRSSASEGPVIVPPPPPGGDTGCDGPFAAAEKRFRSYSLS
jgi:hypothetical protein